MGRYSQKLSSVEFRSSLVGVDWAIFPDFVAFSEILNHIFGRCIGKHNSSMLVGSYSLSSKLILGNRKPISSTVPFCTTIWSCILTPIFRMVYLTLAYFSTPLIDPPMTTRTTSISFITIQSWSQ